MTAATLSPPAAADRPVTITPRNISFIKSLPEAATWLGGDRVATAVFNALSLTFPDGERMFMESVRHFKPMLEGELLAEANAFIAQEAIHTREHVAMNKALDPAHYPLATIRAHIQKNMDIAKGLGPVGELAATIALEHFTALLGNFILGGADGMLDGAPEDMRRLWQWHALEETEHKAVAFDVFNVAMAKATKLRRWTTRLQAMVFTTFEFTFHLSYYASLLLQADGMGRIESRAKVLWFLFGKPGFFRRGLKGYWDWYKPGFHPWHHDNRGILAGWRAQFYPG